MASQAVPRHVACIMDGNGRWAEHRGLARSHGHLASETAVRAALETALAEGVEWLTLFAFSTENWSRPDDEVSFLLRFLSQQMVDSNLQRLHRDGVRVRVLGGDDPRIPEQVIRNVRRAEDLTSDNDRLQLVVAFNYGGRDDIVHGVRALAGSEAIGDDITAETFPRHMRLPGLPDVDLLIRSGGEHRLSNFLLWHCAYAELVFLDVLWPDFRAEHFRHALDLFRRRHRRFGAITPGPAPRAGATQAEGATPAGTAPAAFTAPAAAVNGGAPAAGAAAGAGHDVYPDLLAGHGASPGVGALSLLDLGRLPAAIATHLGASLVSGLLDTARYAHTRLLASGAPACPGASAGGPCACHAAQGR
ncbi:polyprenyl diphosphate synthase [Bailinhaonella thermotolerans]|uniref:Isoprenyl transferase n=1 Tax=Bailinhaonella thermotolerans TaxID=1070861 RepID=A0A3A4AVH7_9ACTN|nr:polyprenyl diphosphate synthase [Bailinhaonella thermotolerans]RJL34240.1 di-trans,poly-cis-decaprenylcistransferase [Bailinhaonella thermotolerans]